MATLTAALERYLAVRRAFGFDLSTAERVLRKFTALADAEGAEHVTVELFLRWKAQYGHADNNTWSARLGMVRGFATWLQGLDPQTEVPPTGLIAGKLRRSKPYIYSDEQIAAIVAEAARLPSAYGLRGWTCATLFGLIATTGLRINEALALDARHVDLDQSVLTIERSKNGRSRVVPLADSTTARLLAYRHERDRLLGTEHRAFFLFESGRRPSDCSARYNFAQVCQRLGLRDPQRFNRHGRGPRIQDLRHSLAVKTIIDWYRCGLDPDREMPKLSAYLGHSKPEHTYWYIEAVPELLELAAERAERALAKGVAQ
jgi:integrase/recombinase XerD